MKKIQSHYETVQEMTNCMTLINRKKVVPAQSITCKPTK